MKISPQSSEPTLWTNSLWTNADKLTSEIFVYKSLHWALYCMIPEYNWIIGIMYN